MWTGVVASSSVVVVAVLLFAEPLTTKIKNLAGINTANVITGAGELSGVVINSTPSLQEPTEANPQQAPKSSTSKNNSTNNSAPNVPTTNTEAGENAVNTDVTSAPETPVSDENTNLNNIAESSIVDNVSPDPVPKPRRSRNHNSNGNSNNEDNIDSGSNDLSSNLSEDDSNNTPIVKSKNGRSNLIGTDSPGGVDNPQTGGVSGVVDSGSVDDPGGVFTPPSDPVTNNAGNTISNDNIPGGVGDTSNINSTNKGHPSLPSS